MAPGAMFIFLCCAVCMVSTGRMIKPKKEIFKTRLLNLLMCGQEGCEERQMPSRSKVFINGNVYTVDQSKDWTEMPAEAIVIEDEKISYVGSTSEAENFIYPGISKVYDLHGSTVLPGFHDIHMHPLEAMSPISSVCKLPSLTRPDSEEFEKELRRCSQYAEGADWVLGGGQSITPMLNYVNESKENVPKYLLDRFIPDKPAIMLEETSHSAWVNSMALSLADITNKTPERPGGVIMREYGTNEPNGLLLENEAINILNHALNPKTAHKTDIYELNYIGLVLALKKVARYGITSLCDARVLWGRDHHKTWEEVCTFSGLNARVILGLWAYPEKADEYQIEKLKKLYSDGNGRCSLRRSQIKVYMDGIVESTTAAMDTPYRVNFSLPGISRENKGLNYFTKERLETYLRALQDFRDGAGFDFHIHAIGDRGISEALDAIESAKSSATSRTPRHRLTHLEILGESDINRFYELGVIADFQVSGDFTLPSEHESLGRLVGMDKANRSIPVRSVVEAGALATFSSDWDVSTVNPLIGIYHAVIRGDESVSIKTAIEMYTVNPAYAMRQDDSVGMLLEGMDADLVIVDKDLLNIYADHIPYTKVLETIQKGKSIYKIKGSKIRDCTDDYVFDDSDKNTDIGRRPRNGVTVH